MEAMTSTDTSVRNLGARKLANLGTLEADRAALTCDPTFGPAQPQFVDQDADVLLKFPSSSISGQSV